MKKPHQRRLCLDLAWSLFAISIQRNGVFTLYKHQVVVFFYFLQPMQLRRWKVEVDGWPKIECKPFHLCQKNVSPRPGKFRELLYMGTLCVSGRAWSRSIVEAVLSKRLSITWTTNNDASTEEAKSRADPAGVEGISKAHNHGFTVSTHREPNGSHNATQSWGNI